MQVVENEAAVDWVKKKRVAVQPLLEIGAFV